VIEQVPAQHQDDEHEVLTGLRAMPLNRATDPLVGHLVVRHERRCRTLVPSLSWLARGRMTPLGGDDDDGRTAVSVDVR
jgi:hypothetical protein